MKNNTYYVSGALHNLSSCVYSRHSPKLFTNTSFKFTMYQALCVRLLHTTKQLQDTN